MKVDATITGTVVKADIKAADLNLDGVADQVTIKKDVTGDGVKDSITFNLHDAQDVAKLKQLLNNSGLNVGDAVSKLPTATLKAATDIGRSLDLANPIAVTPKWETFLAGLATGGEGMDINAIIQHVLREAYLETNKDLQFYADKVKYYNELKKSIRDELTKVREEFAAAMKAKPDAKPTDDIGSVGQKILPTFPDTGLVNEPSGKKASTKKEIEAYIDSLEQQLSSVGDDAQLANIDLQNKLQQQQQTLQTMSNVSKMLHDTAMAIIRKVG